MESQNNEMTQKGVEAHYSGPFREWEVHWKFIFLVHLEPIEPYITKS